VSHHQKYFETVNEITFKMHDFILSFITLYSMLFYWLSMG
jgi:hypothetical protein